MNACEYLARVGYTHLAAQNKVDEYIDDDADQDEVDEVRARVEVQIMQKVRETLLATKAKPIVGRQGCQWIGTITWPDRVPGLQTWTGQVTLSQLIGKMQKALASSDEADLFAVKVLIKGTSGLDSLSSQDSIDVGFSTNAIDIPVFQRVGLELLAIIGLETLPLVSYGVRECGFFHNGKLWKFEVATRDGGYYHRWESVAEVEIGDESWKS